MAASGGADLFLFVAGEPDTGINSTRDVESSVARRVAGALGGRLWLRSPGGTSQLTDDARVSLADERPWHLPPQQIHCVNMVFEIAQGKGRRVTLVDVNRAAGHQDLVDRWVGPDGVLPLLVRLDGTRLEGIEEFVPRKIRRLISGSQLVNPLRSGRSRD